MPITPNNFKDLIVNATGQLCEKFDKLFLLPRTFYEWFTSVYNEDGSFTEEFKDMICAAQCDAANPENPNMPSPSGISASDGTFSDKVQVTWNAVTAPEGIGAVTQYKVYRATSDVTDSSTATLIATVNAPATSYDDTSAVVGTTYNYWVVATNGTHTSAYGGPDVGNASAPTTTLAAISDLRASKGFSFIGGGQIALVFTPPTGATKFDFYRNTVDDSGTATKILSDGVPTLASSTFADAPTPLYDNNGEMLYLTVPPNAFTKYYFWVVAKKDAPPATSPFSNSDIGWDAVTTPPYSILSKLITRSIVLTVTADSGTDVFTRVAHALNDGNAIAFGGTAVPTGITPDLAYFVRDRTADTFKVSATPGGAAVDITTNGTDVTYREVSAVPAGATKLYAVVYGGGGGGAGGGQVYGGGGGGGGGVVVEEFTVAANDAIELTASPDVSETGNAANQTNGAAGSVMTLAINGVSKIVANAGAGGQYNPAGGGAGGALGSGSGTTSPLVYPGHAGEAAAGSAGGAFGYSFGRRRFPGAWSNGFATGISWEGELPSPGYPGGGSYPNSSAVVLAAGGAGTSGFAVLGYGA